MIPLVDIAGYKDRDKKILAALKRVYLSRNYILGKELEEFENEFSEHIGVRGTVGVGNGTDALRLALRSLGVGKGDSVITVAFSSPFTVIPIIEEGAVPIFCDIYEDTLTLDLSKAQRKLKKNTKAIIPVHLYGNPAAMDEIIKFAKKNKLSVIEDACQAHGAKYKRKGVGTIGDAGAFSFYPTKNLGAVGDGGALVSKDIKIVKLAKLLRHGGQTKRFWHSEKGMNSRLDEMQATLLRHKLKYLKVDNASRVKLALRYLKKLSGLPLKFQRVEEGSESVYHLFIVRTKKRDQLRKFLRNKGIMTDIYYPYPIHLQPAFKIYQDHLPITEKVTKEILALPMYPNLTFQAQDYILKQIKKFYS